MSNIIFLIFFGHNVKFSLFQSQAHFNHIVGFVEVFICCMYFFFHYYFDKKKKKRFKL